MTRQVPIRVRTARARSKARDQLRETLRDTSLVQTLVVACDAAGAWTVLSGGMTGADVVQALHVAAQASGKILAHEASMGGAGGPIALDDRVEVGTIGMPEGRKRVPEITTDPDGNLVAPHGEQFMSCAECGASRWFFTTKPDSSPGRWACVRCGNEIAALRMDHEAGHA